MTVSRYFAAAALVWIAPACAKLEDVSRNVASIGENEVTAEALRSFTGDFQSPNAD